MDDARLKKGLGEKGLSKVYSAMKSYVNSLMGNINFQMEDFKNNTKIPKVYTVDVRAFTAAETSSIYTLTLNFNEVIEDYSVFAFCNSEGVGRSTNYWITCQVAEKSSTYVRLNFWNEQKVDIAATTWAILICPN